MPKETWNISDFSGGLNEIVDDRDLEENESSVIDNLIAHHPGSIKLGGVFLPMGFGTSNPGIANLAFSFNEGTRYDPITFVQPSAGFLKFGRGVATISGDVVTLTFSSDTNLASSIIPFRINQTISLVQIDSNVDGGGGYTTDALVGNTFKIASISPGTITLNITKRPDGSSWAFSSHYWYFSVGGKYRDNEEPLLRGKIKANELNKYALLSNGYGAFGYFDILDKTFVGNNNYYTDSLKLDQHYFDTRYLWNLDNRNNQLANNNTTYTAVNKEDKLIRTLETSYMDGVVRVVEEAPEYWETGHVRRPVGLYFIKGHKKFNSLEYVEGWYPLVTHCLSTTQIRKDVGQNTQIGNNAAVHHRNAGLIATNSSIPTAPDYAHLININVSETASSIPGSWQFAAGEEFASIGLGISLIYDDINHKDFGTFSQESSVSLMSTSTASNEGTDLLTTINGNNDRCLTLKYSINEGAFNTNGASYQSLFGVGGTAAIPEQRGRLKANGSSNWEAWNPRIVGANIYLVASAIETYKSPLWLATIDFTKPSGSYSHDGRQSTEWVSEKQSILNIASVPIMDFRTKNSFEHDEPNQMWWKTSAMVNRKMYSANLTYFEETKPTNDPGKAIKKPDSIVVSPDSNKFDIMPLSITMDIAKADGQDINKLLNFNNELLIFKTNDLVVVDCSGEDEIIKDTFYGKGIYSGGQCVANANAVFFCNKNGFFAYDGENITDLSINKFTTIHWNKHIYTNKTRLLYDEQYNLILITSSDVTWMDSNRLSNGVAKYMYIYNIDNGSFTFKSTPIARNFQQNCYFSNGINVDGVLHVATSTMNDNFLLEEANLRVETEAVQGTRAKYTVQWHTSDGVGTQIGFNGATCEQNYLNTNMAYIKIYNNKTSGSWKLLNSTAFAPSYDQAAVTDTNDVHELSSQSNNAYLTTDAITESVNDVTSPDYLVDARSIEAPYDYTNSFYDRWFELTIEATKPGADYNIIPQDLSSVNAIYGNAPASEVDSGKLGIVFSNNNSVGALGSISPQIGNIREIKDLSGSDFYTVGTDSTYPVYRYAPDRKGSYQRNVQYTISLICTTYDNIYIMHYTYLTGVDYFLTNNYNGDVTTDSNDVLSSSTDAEKNDAIVGNFAMALQAGNIVSDSTHSDYVDIPMSNIAAITSGGTSGSKYIQLTLLDNDFVNSKISWDSSFDVTSGLFNGALQVWANDLPLDENGSSVYNCDNLLYITKDIDFGQPNIRKKVYKVYITYTGGNGNVRCYYKVNQSGGWTAANVKDNDGADATKNNRLNSSTTQTRGELDFGTGTNNIYSIQLKFESISRVVSFEINDISIIYRTKNIK